MSLSSRLIRKVAFSGNLDLLSEFMDKLNLVDILRIKNPSKKCFTYESSALKMTSRIDFFLIPKSLIASTKTADIKTEIAPDRKPLDFSCNSKARKGTPEFISTR